MKKLYFAYKLIIEKKMKLIIEERPPTYPSTYNKS